jgi:5-methylcytosine-specific restriction endonuclease McrA
MSRGRGRWDSNSEGSALSNQSTATLRARLADLRRTERTLTVQMPQQVEPSTSVRAALSRLDEPTKAVLKRLEGAAVYREWVERTRSKIAELEQVVQRATPSHMNAYLTASLNRWWVLVLTVLSVPFINGLINSLYGPRVDSLWLYPIVYCVLSVLLISPCAARKYAEATFTYEKRQSELEFLKGIECKRTGVAKDIKVADAHLKTVAKLEKDRSELARVQRDINAYVSVINKRSDKSRTGVPSDVKHAVWVRDGGVCVKCRRGKADGTRLHFDHIIPYSLGGADTEENIQLLCVTCNLKKGARL